MIFPDDGLRSMEGWLWCLEYGRNWRKIMYYDDIVSARRVGWRKEKLGKCFGICGALKSRWIFKKNRRSREDRRVIWCWRRNWFLHILSSFLDSFEFYSMESVEAKFTPEFTVNRNHHKVFTIEKSFLLLLTLPAHQTFSRKFPKHLTITFRILIAN